MKATLGLLADYANVTPEGKLNIMGIFQVINAVQFPHVHPQLHLIVSLEAAAAEAGKRRKLEISLMTADGQTVFKIGGDLEVPKGQAPGPVMMNHIIGLNGLRFDKEGDYQFSVLVDEDEKRTIPLKVVKVSGPAPR